MSTTATMQTPETMSDGAAEPPVEPRRTTGREPDPAGGKARQLFEISEEQTYVLTNCTPYVIRLQCGAHADAETVGEYVVPPFAQRLTAGARLKPFEAQIWAHRQRHELSVRPFVDRKPSPAWLIWAVWIAVLTLAVVVVVDVLSKGSLHQWEFYGAASAAVIAVTVALCVAASHDRSRRRSEAKIDKLEGDVEYGVGEAFLTANETRRRTRHLLTLILVVVVGAVLPAAAIIVGTDTKDFLSFAGGLQVLPGNESKFVARVIQITYTAILSLFPALLFFQFERSRVGTIRGQWVRSIFRMDNRLRTMADLNAYYGDELSEASNYSADSVRYLGGKHSPIVVATILITLGWTILVLRTDSFDFAAVTAAQQEVELAEEAAAIAEEAANDVQGNTDPFEQAEAEATAAQALDEATNAQEAVNEIAEESSGTAEPPPGTLPDVTSDDQSTSPEDNAAQLAGQTSAVAKTAALEQREVQSTSFFQVLAPTPSAAAMAFLGAYFFGVYLVLRSYFRGDLRPKVYNQITARLVTVVVLAYLINAMLADAFDEPTFIWAMAFVAGVMPTTAVRKIVMIGGSAGRRFGRWSKIVPESVDEAFSTSRPLTQIDGIDLYDASRLETEGVPDVPALADSRLASVMVNSRLPIGRLIDWADQASLMVVVSGGDDETVDCRIKRLRAVGIRTATDFTTAYESGNAEMVAAIEQCLEAGPADAVRQSVAGNGSNGARTEDHGNEATSSTGNGASRPAAEADRSGGSRFNGADADADGTGDNSANPGNEANLGNGSNRDDGSNSGNGAAAPARSGVPCQAPRINAAHVCATVRNQRVMSAVRQWRNSPLARRDQPWIELPPLRYTQLDDVRDPA